MHLGATRIPSTPTATLTAMRFLLQRAPDNRLPDPGMPALDAMRLIGEELLLDGIPSATWRRSSRRGWSPRRS